MKSFHDDAAGITYFYPSSLKADGSSISVSDGSSKKCEQTSFSAVSDSGEDTSAFTISTIDNDCLKTLASVVELRPLVKKRVQSLLEQQGQPVAADEPTSYTIGDRAAAFSSAKTVEARNPAHLPATVYAVEACMLDAPMSKERKKFTQPPQVHKVYCYGFVTHDRGHLNDLYMFLINFQEGSPQSMFALNAVRALEAKASH